MTDPMGKSEAYTYDLSGNMITKTDRNGTKFGYEYDALNRLKKEYATVGGTQVVRTKNTYYNDTINNTDYGCFKQENSNGIFITFCNVLNQPFFERVAQNDKYYTITYNYKEGNLVTHKYINTTNKWWDTLSQVGDYNYGYDDLDRLTSVAEKNSSTLGYDNIATYTYDDNGNISSVKYANGTSAVYSYNYANLVTSMTNKKGSTTLSSYAYTYSYDGNQIKKTDNTGRVDSYTYDNLGRLTSERINDLLTEYTYDLAGNRATMKNTYYSYNETNTITYTYDANNRMLSRKTHCDDFNFIKNYGYDNNGN